MGGSKGLISKGSVAGQWVTMQRKLPDWATCVNVRTVWPPLMIDDGRFQSLWCEG